MTPTRRRLTQGLSAAGIASLSGCVGSIIAGDSEGSDESDSSQNQEQDQSTDQTQDENEEESDSDDDTENQLDSSQFSSRITTLYDYYSWLSSEYDDARSTYSVALYDLHQRLQDLHARDPKNVSLDELDSVTTAIDDIEARAKSLFGEYYTTHYPFSTASYTLSDRVRPSLRRGEYESAWGDLRRVTRFIGEATDSDSINQYYPRYVVHRNPYLFFTTAEDRDSLETNRIFETQYSGDNGSVELFATPRNMNIKQHPFGVTQPADRFDTLESYPARDTNIFSLGEWLSTSQADQSLYLNIIDYKQVDNRYPRSFLMPSESDSDGETSISDLQIPNFNDPNSVRVFIQTFGSTETAVSYLDTLRERATVDSTVTYYGREYEQMFYESSSLGETVYADITQVGPHVVSLDLSSVQWPDRYDSSSFDSNQARVSHHLKSTLFDTPSESSSQSTS